MRLTQSMGNGYQATKPKKTAQARLDYSEAFDHVWREDLIYREIDKGISIGFVTFSPAEKKNCRSTVAEADSYHYARDFRKGPSSRSSSFCKSATFGELQL